MSDNKSSNVMCSDLTHGRVSQRHANFCSKTIKTNPWRGSVGSRCPYSNNKHSTWTHTSSRSVRETTLLTLRQNIQQLSVPWGDTLTEKQGKTRWRNASLSSGIQELTIINKKNICILYIYIKLYLKTPSTTCHWGASVTFQGFISSYSKRLIWI